MTERIHSVGIASTVNNSTVRTVFDSLIWDSPFLVAEFFEKTATLDLEKISEMGFKLRKKAEVVKSDEDDYGSEDVVEYFYTRPSTAARGFSEEVDALYIQINNLSNQINIVVATWLETEAKEIVQVISGNVKYQEVSEEDSTSISIWFKRAGYADSLYRGIETPKLDEIADNYTSLTLEELVRTIGMVHDARAGKIIVWHGPAGVGKTFAIRALMRELRDDFSFHYILDPENFFGPQLEYMIQVLVRQQTNGMVFESMGGTKKKKTKTMFLILEDVGEFIRHDAKEQAGQALSRLLNITDGIVGQGVDFRILLTTNEDVTYLHPAITRDGRCLSVVGFDSMPIQQANEWLAQHDCNQRVNKETTLAELYSLVYGTHQNTKETVVGGPNTTGQYM